ncbi:MAG: hypothetical protein KBS41_04885 [Oscillospiraceae bacterium]|nr:hypothetical protein [Candidatus Equicaccousia limihippi]
MKKTVKIFVCTFLLGLLLCADVLAQSPQENFEAPEFPQIELPQSASDTENKMNIDNTDANWYQNFDIKGVFAAIGESVKENYAAPFSFLLAVCAVVCIDAAFLSKVKDSRISGFIAVATAAGIMMPLFKALEQTSAVLSELSNFMMAFLPMFFGVMVSSGNGVTTAAVSPILLTAVTVFEKILCGAFLPFMGCYLAMSVCSGLSSRLNISSVCEKLKKSVLWVMGGICVIFIGILSAVSSASSGADRVALRAGKYLAGSIPAVGSAISESLSLAVSSAAAIKGSFGGLGMISIAAVLLPPLITLLLWKGALLICSFLCESFCSSGIGKFTENVSGAISVVMGILVFSGMSFIIALSVVLGV